VSRVCGDAYAGEWPRERFAAHGIAYDVSKRNKSAIYAEFLPALNGQRVRLLDQPRLIGQFCALERRTARGGRDSIDHQPGSSDDVANAAAGVLVDLIADRRPALIRANDLLTDGMPASLPVVCDAVFATVAVDDHGSMAIVYAARSRFMQPPLTLLDFDAAGLTAATWTTMAGRLRDLAHACRARHGSYLFLPEALAPSARAAGCLVITIPRNSTMPPKWPLPHRAMSRAEW
jgi:hypothetical protein